MGMQRMIVKGVLANALVAAGVTTAMASTVALSDTTTSTGLSVSGANTSLVTPGSYYYGNTFGAGSGGTPVSLPTQPDGFYDDFVFTISGATADSITSTINLSNVLEIDGLQVALFNYTPGQTVPVTGSPVTTGWSTQLNFNGVSGTYSVISPTALSAGSYVLEVKGTVSGSAGGSYSGTLNLAPVPLPAGFPLLLSGLGFVGLWGRRRLS